MFLKFIADVIRIIITLNTLIINILGLIIVIIDNFIIITVINIFTFIIM